MNIHKEEIDILLKVLQEANVKRLYYPVGANDQVVQETTIFTEAEITRIKTRLLKLINANE